MIEKEDRIKLFINELNYITEEKIRKFAEILIENADDYFFEIAASTTGKYHPQFDLGPGGLVRHTRCVAFFAQCEAESRMFSEHDKNLLIVSALAHDIKKLGDGSGKYTVGDHPKWASDYVMSTFENNKGLITKKDATTISNIVLSHMGKWGEKDGMPLPKTELEKSLQAADYIASRKEILSFGFKTTENVSGFGVGNNVNESKNIENGHSGDYTFTFGKYNGKSIKEVYEIEKENLNKGYLMWMINKEDFNMSTARNNAIIYFNELGILPEKFIKEADNLNEQKEQEPIIIKESDSVDDLPF